MSDILQYTAVELAEQMKAGRVTVREALDAVMAQIEKREEKEALIRQKFLQMELQKC